MTRRLRHALLTLILTLMPLSGFAGWAGCRIILDGDCIDYEIADIFTEVGKANSALEDRRPVMQMYLDQRTHWLPYRNYVDLITDGITDVVEKLPPARERYLAFVGSPKCAASSTCYAFQNDLMGFFDELTDLNQSFPALQRAGLQDSGAVAQAILDLPPIALYSAYRALENIPGWQQLPQDLGDIFDEIDDADVFRMKLRDDASLGMDAMPRAAVSAFSDMTRTQRFCARRADKFDGVGRGRNGNRDGWDEVRLNRVILVVTLFSDIWSFGLDQVPDDIDIGVSLVGEGGTLGIPSVVFTWFFKTVPLALESILKAVQVHRENIGLCETRFAQIEGRLVSCGHYSDFVLDGAARDEYYALVERRFDMADAAGITHVKSDTFFERSESKLREGKYQQAYEQLCEAYQTIGAVN